MNTCISCRVVSSIFFCLDETCVICILMPAVECTKIVVNGGMSVCDYDHDAVKEYNVWVIDGHNGGGALFHGDTNQTVSRKG